MNFIIGGVCFSIITVFAVDILINADQVSYKSINVSEALDTLLDDMKTHCPDDSICYKASELYKIIAANSKGKLTITSGPNNTNPFASIEDGTNGTNGVWEYDESLGANADGGGLPIYYFRGNTRKMKNKFFIKFP